MPRCPTCGHEQNAVANPALDRLFIAIGVVVGVCLPAVFTSNLPLIILWGIAGAIFGAYLAGISESHRAKKANQESSK